MTYALFDLSTPETGPFPSNRFTVPDPSHNTGLRVDLPKPPQGTSGYDDIGVLNELDGFNLQPRLSIPFDGAIDHTTVTKDSVFLVRLGSTLPGGEPGGQKVGVDQVVWDTLTTTLHVGSDQLLDQHTRYVLVVTKKLKDAGGDELKATNAYHQFVAKGRPLEPGDLGAYQASLRDALDKIGMDGPYKVVPPGQVVSASVFSTQSVTAVLEKIRDQIKAKTPAPADFLLGPPGPNRRTVFPRSAVKSWDWNKQTKSNPPQFTKQTIPIGYLDVVKDAVGTSAVGTIAFGKYSSPDYRHPGEYIPALGTLSGTPDPVVTSEITFALFLPSSQKPATGYPVVINGTDFPHGGGVIAAKMAQQGIATIAISEPGHGCGPSSTYKLTFRDSTSVTFRSGGRGIDQNGDGKIGDSEGWDAATPRRLQGPRDGRRQMVADLMQLVRVIQVGVDVDGDNGPDDPPDLDPSRIYYCGVSGGANYGIMLLAIEPSVRFGVLCVIGGGVDGRLSATGRDALGKSLQSRLLVNSPGVTSIEDLAVDPPYFNENMPLPNGAPFSVDLQDGSSQVVQSPITNTVDGAMEIQQFIEYDEWAWQGDPVAYAPYIRRRPLNGVPPKSVIIQFPKGDRNIPNLTTTAILRAGDLADCATFVRTDLIFTQGNPIVLPGNPYFYPHVYMGNAINPPAQSPISPDDRAKVKAIAIKAQHQIATFFASDGTDVIYPDDVHTTPDLDVHIFEVPILLPLPEALYYLKNKV